MNNGKTSYAPPIRLAPLPNDGVTAELRPNAGKQPGNLPKSPAGPSASRRNPRRRGIRLPSNPHGAATAATFRDAGNPSL
jgi:hypothetical protein